MDYGWPSIKDEFHACACILVDITLVDESTRSGDVIGVSSTSGILDAWDDVHHCPSADPYVLDLCAVQSVLVP